MGDLFPNRVRLHQPVVVETRDKDVWGVICDACSHEAQEYVETCLVPSVARAWPPLRLVSAPARTPSQNTASQPPEESE